MLHLAPAKGQSKVTSFTGAKANKHHHKLLYILNSCEEKRISATLININNALEDPRLKDKLEVELTVFGDGVDVFGLPGVHPASLKCQP